MPLQQLVQEPEPISANQALWEKGDFTRIAASMRQSGENLVAGLGVSPGLRVLDLGCGDGTTAIPAARLGAQVLGVDIARNLVNVGNRRAAEQHLDNLRFEQGDASGLVGLDSQAFDLVISVFGAMFAPRPFDVAAEMVRVTKRGGRIIMGNWIPDDPTLVAQILKISAAYSPPPAAGFISPMTWGIEANVIERFAAAGISAGQISCSTETYLFQSPHSPVAFVDLFRRFYGPTINAFEAANGSNRADHLRAELETLFQAQNISAVEGTTEIPATFLRVSISV